jgi:surface polysaccharide O-acyltransferase-like enzyme
MNPDYLWLTGALQLLTLFIVGPIIAIAIAYASWRRKPQNFNPKRYGMLCVASGVSASLMLVLAKWINADVRTPQYFLQLACALLGGLLLGVGMGCFFPVLLHVWRWHNTTRLADHNQTDR